MAVAWAVAVAVAVAWAGARGGRTSLSISMFGILKPMVSYGSAAKSRYWGWG